ncbi:hypothetical protein [Streptomyces chiangmaiensis]|uniref:Phage tail protein n=1 Tax=Streptomyces chiangmaiensis TaxID=766497 RepID=A0ABU7FGJ1_9ACTN|nr:hypothetical protein [Streptomyces chiangmaiensis]MED7822968.1 hypothetical protein [Streptomyces chiangmaiensis]
MSLVVSLSRATTALGRLRSAAGSTGSALNTIRSRTGQADTAVGKLRTGLGTADTALGKSRGSTDKFKTSLDKLKGSSNKAQGALRDVKRQSDAVEKSVGKAGKQASTGGRSMGSLGKGLKGASLAQKGLNLAMAANPFGLVMAILAPLISQFINMDKVTALVAKGVKWAFNAILGVVRNHAGPIKSVLKGIINAFTALPRAYISGINFMISALNRIHVSIPSWVPVIGGKSFSIHIPQIPNIPTLAQGGIVPARAGGSLAIVGEGGEPEAVIPLSRLDSMIGSGGGLRRLAAAVERLADRPVVVQVDSQTIARAVFLGQRQLARR